MSCCGGNCGCGSSCGCGSGCKGCKMYPDLVENSANPVISPVDGLAPKASYMVEGSEMGVAAENDGCKCGADCKCNPCTCK